MTQPPSATSNGVDDVDVVVGQIWADNEWTERARGVHGRRLEVVEVDGIYAVVDNVRTGVRSRIRLDRFRPTTNGFRLIEKEPVPTPKPYVVDVRMVVDADNRALAEEDVCLLFSEQLGELPAVKEWAVVGVRRV